MMLLTPFVRISGVHFTATWHHLWPDAADSNRYICVVQIVFFHKAWVCVLFLFFLFALDAANAVACVSDVCFTKLCTSLPGAASSVYLCFRWCISWLPFQLPVVPDTACLLQVVYFTKHCFCSSFCPSSCYSCASGGAFHRVQLTLLLCIRWCTLQSTMNSVPVSQLVCFTEHN